MRIILCPESTVIDNEHTHTHTSNMVPYVHRLFCNRSSPTSCWWHSHSQKHINRGQSSGHKCACHKQWYACNWLSLKDNENPQLEWSQCLCNNTLASPQCSFHNSNYCFTGTCIGRYYTLAQHVFPTSARVTVLHTLRVKSTSLCVP